MQPDPHRRARRRLQPRGGRARRRARLGVRLGRAPSQQRRRVRRRGRGAALRARPARRGRRRRRDRARLLPRPLRPGRPAPGVRGSDRDREPVRQAGRDPHARPRRVRGGRHGVLRHPGEGGRVRRDPALLLGCAPVGRAGRRATAGTVSFAGNSTYPKAEGLREAAALVPEDRILVETDSPVPRAPAGPRQAEPAGERRRDRRADRRGARRLLRGAGAATVEANAARVFGW